MHRPPSAPSTSISDLCSILESLLLSHKHVVACGDLNIDTSNSTHPFTKSLQTFITSHSMSCPISHPTRISETHCSVLDYFLTSSEVPISHSSVLNSSISDHLPIVLSIDWSVPDRLQNHDHTFFQEVWAFCIQWGPYCCALVSTQSVWWCGWQGFCFQFTLRWCLWLSCSDEDCVCKEKLSRSIRKEMGKRNKLLRRFLGAKSPSAWNEFESQRNLVDL